MADVHVLLIDDDEGARKGLARYLRSVAEFKVTEYGNGPEALEHLETTELYYTAVLLDFVLTPAMSGDRVLNAIRTRHPRLPVIVFTGLDPVGGVRALGKGVYRYMRRPINHAEMANAIRDLAEQDMVFYEMARDVRRMLRSDLCLAWRLDRLERRFHVAAWVGENLDEEYRQNVFLELDSPATREFFAAEKPIYLRDVKDLDLAPYYQHQKHAERLGWTSLISIPLVRQGRVIGLIDSYTYKLRKFANKAERERWLEVILPAFANQADEAIRHTELTNQLQALHGLNQILAGTFEEEVVIKQILSKAIELVGTDTGWLFLLDVNTQKLVLKHGQGIPAELIGQKQGLGEGMSGVVAREGKALIATNVSEGEIDQAVPGVVAKSAIAVPLRREEQTIGVLTVTSRFLDAFTDDDVGLLMSLATQATIIIGRTQLTRHLQEVSRLTLTSKPGKLVNYIVQAAYELTGAEVLFWMIDRTKKGPVQIMQPVAYRGDFTDGYMANARVPITASNSSITALAFERGRPIIRKDVLDDQEKPEEPMFYNRDEAIRRGWHAFMAVPLLGDGGQRFGSLSLYSKEIGKFGEPDAEIMQTFANQAAIAFESIQSRRNLEQLVQSGRITIEHISDEAQVLQQFVEQACQLTGAPCAVMYPYDPERQRFYNRDRVVASGLLSEAKDITDKVREKGLAVFVRHTDQIVVHDLDTGEIEAIDYSSMPEPLDRVKLLEYIRNEPFVIREKVKAFVGIPLRAAGYGSAEKDLEEVGILYINYRKPHRFTSSELDLIRLFSQQVANLIRAARLWARLQEQLTLSETLVKTGRAIGQAMSREEILKSVFRQAFQFVGRITGSVMLIEPDRRLRILDSVGISKKQMAVFHGRPTYAGEGSFGILVRKEQDIFESLDTSKDLEAGQMIDFGLPIPSQVTNIPLMCEGDVVGILVLDTVAPNDRVRSALISLANVARIALERTRSREHSRQQLDALRKVVGAIGAEFDPLPVILKEAVELFGAEYGFVSVVDPVARQVIFRAIWERGQILVGEQIPEHKRARDWDVGITGRVAQTSQAYRTGNTAQDPHYEKWYETTISELAVPLVGTEGKTIGVLNLESPIPDAFSQAEEDLYQDLANVAATVIEKDKLFEAMQRLNAQLENLHRILQEQRLDQVLHRTLQGINAILGEGTSSSIALYDERIDSFYPQCDPVGPLKELLWPLPRPDGFGRYVLGTGKPLYVDDVHNLPSGYPMMRDENIAHGVRSFAAIPIKRQEQVIGVLFVNAQSDVSFTADLGRILQLFASQAAVAIENVQLYEQRGKDIAALQSINEAVTSKGRNEILKLIVDKAIEVMPGEYSSLWLKEPGSGDLVLEAIHRPVEGTIEEVERLRAKERSISMQVVKTGRARIIDDAEREPGFRRTYQEARSALVVPLKYQGNVIGALDVESSQLSAFTEEHRRLLDSFAGQAAIAIENARLFEDLQERTRTLSALYDAGQILTSALDPKEVAGRILDELGKVVGYRKATMQLVHGDTRELIDHRGLGTGVIDQWLLRPISQDHLVRRIIRGKKPFILSEVSQDPDWETFSGTIDVQSWVGLPLIHGNRTIGLLTLDHDQPGYYTEAIRDRLVLFGNQAAIAVRNARLHADLERQVERLRTLNQISHKLSAQLDENSICKTVVEAVVQTLDCMHCTIFMLKDDLLVPQAFHTKGEDIKITRCFALGEGLAGWVAQKGRSVLLLDVKKDKRFSQGMTRPEVERSLILVPVRVGRRVVGVISADEDRINAFDKSDLQLTETLALQTGIALENASLFKQEQQRANAMDLLQRIGARISETLDLEKTLALIMEGAMRLTKTESGVIHLLDESKSSVIHSYEFPAGFHTPSRFSEKKGMTWTVVENGRIVVVPDITQDKRVNPEMAEKGVKALIGVPLSVVGESIGALFLNDTESRVFTEYEKELLSTLADQAAIAIENARLYQSLRRKISELEVLTEIGRTVSNLGIDQILDLVYKEMGKINDLSDAQVQFAFYDETKDEVSFPLAVEQDNGVTIDVVRLSEREAPYYVGNEDRFVEQFLPRVRRTPPGLTEYVIRTKQPLLLVEDFEQKAAVQGIKVWPTFGRLDRETHSWLGVPMIVQNRVIGIISIQSLEVEHAFDQGQLGLLSTVANQAAVAIENARLYAGMEQMVEERTRAWQREQERADAAEKLALMSDVAAEFAHRMNNLAGTIPVRVDMARENLAPNNSRDARVIKQLDSIASDAKLLLDAAQEIKRTTEMRAPEFVDVNAELETALGRVWSSKPEVEGRIQVGKDVTDDLPSIYVERNKLLDTLVSVIQNGVEAMPEGGTLTVATRQGSMGNKPCIEIVISDTGIGIPAADRLKIFDLFFTTKAKGLGFGLWRDRMFAKNLGGDIEVNSTVGVGTVFTIKIPVPSDTLPFEGGQNA